MTDPDRQRAEERAAKSDAEWRAIDRLNSEYDREPSVERRRIIDERFEAIEKSMKDLKEEVAENTDLTKQIRDLLASFRVLAQISKWGTAVGAFGLMLYHVWQRATGR